MESVPVVLAVRVGLTVPAELVRLPVIVPLPRTLPPSSVSGVLPDIAMLPPFNSVDPPVWVYELPSKSVPDLEMTVPELVKVIVLDSPPPLTPIPPVFSNVPALLKVGEPPSHSI